MLTNTFINYPRNTSVTYLLIPWCRVLLEKLTGLQLVKKFPAFHGTRSFITALTSVRHLSLSWASPIQSIYPDPTSWRSILIFTHLCLGLASGLFPFGFLTKTLYTPLSSPIRATCPAHLITIQVLPGELLFKEGLGSFPSLDLRPYTHTRTLIHTQRHSWAARLQVEMQGKGIWFRVFLPSLISKFQNFFTRHKSVGL